jgi:hypothetical protein
VPVTGCGIIAAGLRQSITACFERAQSRDVMGWARSEHTVSDCLNPAVGIIIVKIGNNKLMKDINYDTTDINNALTRDIN